MASRQNKSDTASLRVPLHPGEILREQFLQEFGLSINRLARDLRVPPTRISEIVNEARGISPDTAMRLARYCGTTAEFWMNLQSAYDLDVAQGEQSEIDADVCGPIAEQFMPAQHITRCVIVDIDQDVSRSGDREAVRHWREQQVR